VSLKQETYDLIAFYRGPVHAYIGLALFYFGLGGLLILYQGAGIMPFLGLALVPIFVWISITDIETHELPDLGALTVATLGLALAALQSIEVFLISAFAGALIYSILWTVGTLYFSKFDSEGLGLGDAKLLAAGACLFGLEQSLDMIFIASVGGCIGWLAKAVISGKSTDPGIAFGPYIAFAIFVLCFLPNLLSIQ
jgi:leader peptidase (prepilin peptidase)/N-methyltransferase